MKKQAKKSVKKKEPWVNRMGTFHLAGAGIAAIMAVGLLSPADDQPEHGYTPQEISQIEDMLPAQPRVGSGVLVKRPMEVMPDKEEEAPQPETQVTEHLMNAIKKTESNFNPNARSKAGAVGECQIMPATAAMYGMNPYDPKQNCVIGRIHLTRMFSLFDDKTLAVAAYNAGEGRIARWLAKGGELPEETRNYVHKVLLAEAKFKRLGVGRDFAQR